MRKEEEEEEERKKMREANVGTIADGVHAPH